MAAALTFLQAAEESYGSLKELVEKSRSSDLPDFDKKRGILQYLVKTQQRMLRLNVIAKWFQQNESGYRFVKLYDPPMCPRSKRIILGLLKRINKNEEEIAKLKSKMRSGSRGEDGETKVMGRTKKCTSMLLLVVGGLIVLLIAYFTSTGLGKNESLGYRKKVYMLP